MVDVRVDARVAHEAEQVDVPAALERGEERGVLEEGPVLDRLVHPHQVLVEPAAGADRQVTDLGVPHLARREPRRLARGLDRRVRVAPPQVVEDGRVRQLDGVPRPRRRAAPAVEDDERYERCGVAARQIAANGSTSSEAPPTRAPSMWRWAQSSPAFSGFTEPP